MSITTSRDPRPVAARVARKDTLKKFPALPLLIVIIGGALPNGLLVALTEKGEPAEVVREFLSGKQLIWW